MDIHTIHRAVGGRFRQRRMRKFLLRFNIKDSDRIIDIGGYPATWRSIPEKPKILIVNLEEETYEGENLKKIKGDGRALGFPDKSFDIAYSNSVIEHVGTYADRVAFAEEIMRVATRYYVQTPYKWFFIEPHFLGLFISHLSHVPRPILRKIVRYLSVWGLVTRPSQEKIDHWLDTIHLLDCRELQELFPGAEIREEKFLGMTKSILAIRA
jgi:hypothetical protein